MRRTHNWWQIGLRALLASSLFGATLDVSCTVPGLDRMRGVGKTLASNFNPCGTIIDCDPVEWDLMFHSFPDWDLDPTCTIPGLCGGSWPPGTGSGGTVDTTTDTTTTDTTTTDTTTTDTTNTNTNTNNTNTGG